MFQKFQDAQMMSYSSSIVTLAQACNSTVCFTSTAPNTWVINSGASDHMTKDKNILSTLFCILTVL